MLKLKDMDAAHCMGSNIEKHYSLEHIREVMIGYVTHAFPGWCAVGAAVDMVKPSS